MSVNLSPRSLTEGDLPGAVRVALQFHGLPAEALLLEITESTIMADVERASLVLAALRADGVHTALDDFGTGHSSLTQLRAIPVDEIKLDRSFLAGIEEDAGARRLIATAVTLCHDLGKTVVLVERWPTLGGVCLNVGCIPSKALLHAAKVIDEADEMGHAGVSFGKPSIDLDTLRGWKDGVVRKLTGGLVGLAKQRKVAVVTGTGRFTAPNEVSVEGADGAVTTVTFEHAIIAAGSEPVTLPFIPQDDPRVLDSTDALGIDEVPGTLLVVGGGIIGLEMATVYHALGSKVTIVELMDQIIPGADKDIITPLAKRIEKRYANIYLKTKVLKVEPTVEGLVAHFEGPKAPAGDIR